MNNREIAVWLATVLAEIAVIAALLTPVAVLAIVCVADAAHTERLARMNGRP